MIYDVIGLVTTNNSNWYRSIYVLLLARISYVSAVFCWTDRTGFRRRPTSFII